MIRILKKMMPSRAKDFLKTMRKELFDGYAMKSYSQEGEDMILKRIFDAQSTGFYVDVGAHHPKRFSNTFFFYKKGWRGINIDAMPGSMTPFRKQRPRDINLEMGVSSSKGVLKYYSFNEPALNSFSKALSEERDRADSPYNIIEEIDVATEPLSTILEKHLPPGSKIDFLSIDVEGLDLEVLSSSDWEKYRPTIVLAEILNGGLAGLDRDPVASFLKTKGYEPYAKCSNTFLFRKIS